jgi:zinc resistance-associated protein
MKRLVVTLGVLMVAAALAVPVMAWGPGFGREGFGPGDCPRGNRGAPNLTDEQKKALGDLRDRFLTETKDLRAQLQDKHEEMDALLDGAAPDAAKAKALQKEISDLRAKLADKRLDFQLEARKISPEAGMKLGRGYGRGMKGFGPGPYGPGGGPCH